MLYSTEYSDNVPFSVFSTFTCTGLQLPRGLFYGGCFYTTTPYTPPVRIAKLFPGDGTYTGHWTIQDYTDKPLGAVYFTAGNALGNIIDVNGNYAGCLKARTYDYAGHPLTGGDLQVFLSGITKEYTLDKDSLMFDINHCYRLPENLVSSSSGLEYIYLPDDCLLDTDAIGNYYLKVNAEAPTVLYALRELSILPGSSGTLSAGVLSGTHLSIVPQCTELTTTAVISAAIVDGDPVSTTAMLYSGGSMHGVEDIAVDIVDGAIVITTLKQFSDLNG